MSCGYRRQDYGIGNCEACGRPWHRKLRQFSSTSSSGGGVPPWIQQPAAQEAHWSVLATSKGKGYGSKGGQGPDGSGFAPNLDRLRQELVASGEALGTRRQVAQVIKAEYEASLQQRVWSGIPTATQLVQARTQAQDTLRSLCTVQSHMATTSAQLEQLLRTRSWQISDELELLERYKWERPSKISSLLELTRLEEARGRATIAQGGSSSDSNRRGQQQQAMAGS